MKAKKLFAMLLSAVLVLGFASTAFAADEPMILIAPAKSNQNITIACTNDVHCGYEVYDKLATVRNQVDILVDAGDAIQGGIIGTLSKGEYITEIMNYIGYDVATLGNHEFDFSLNQIRHIADDIAEFPYVNCNLYELATGNKLFDSYKIIEAKGKKVAFVGITTPETFKSSTPTFFQDENGNYIYSFSEGRYGEELYETVQKAIDSAKAEGADYVIALAHLGDSEDLHPWTSDDVIANTTGLDFLIDGHSHNIYSDTIANKDGKEIGRIQTGTKLENIGMITISKDGTISSELIPTESIESEPSATDFIACVTAKFDELQKKVVAHSDIDLTIKGEDGKRAVRKQETNLGDLCSDAYRIGLGADIGFVNGGGVRTDIPAGDINFGQVVAVHPFGNMACLVEVTGQQVKDALELGAAAYPAETGGFLQVSGLTYDIDLNVESNVVLNANSEFVKVDGEYRVKNIMVGGQPLDENKTYTLAATDYMLKNAGDGFAMFGKDNVTLLLDSVLVDNQVLINYIVDYLGGEVGEEYAQPQGRITIIPVAEEEPAETPAEEPTPAEPQVITYTVQNGDWLSKIAKKYYGDPMLWPKIYDANRAIIKNPNLIYTGQELIIPAA